MSSLTSASRGPSTAGCLSPHLNSPSITAHHSISSHTPLSPRALQSLLEGDDETFENAVVAMDVPSLLELVHALQNSMAIEQR